MLLKVRVREWYDVKGNINNICKEDVKTVNTIITTIFLTDSLNNLNIGES